MASRRTVLPLALVLGLTVLAFPLAYGAEEKEEDMIRRVLAIHDRWDPQSAPGDRYVYLVCQKAATCYNLELVALDVSGDTITWNATITDVLGHYKYDGDGTAYRGFVPAGKVDDDMFMISYEDMSDAREPFQIIYDGRLHSIRETPGFHTSMDMNSIQDTLLFVGGNVRIGDGGLLQHRPILETGEVWTRQGYPQMIVDGTSSSYAFDGTTHTGKFWRLSYHSDAKTADILLMPELAFPVSVTTTTDYDEIRDDQAIRHGFWLRMIQGPGIGEDAEGQAAELPEPEAPDVVTGRNDTPPAAETPEGETLPDPEDHNIIDEITGIPGMIAGIISDLITPPGGEQDRTDDDGREGETPMRQQPSGAFRTDREMYDHGDTVTFSGTTHSQSPIQVAVYSADGTGVASFVAEPDGSGRGWSLGVRTGAWDGVHGQITATMTQDSDMHSLTFTLGPQIRLSVDGRAVTEWEIGENYVTAVILAGSSESATMAFPRAGLDSRTGGEDAGFDVFVDGREAEYVDASNETHRILVISGLPRAEHLVDIFQLGTDVAECTGTASCLSGTVADVIDGDTIRMHDGTRIRLALVSAPEIFEPGGQEAKEAALDICPPGARVTVDEDDGQTSGSYGRTIGVVYCESINLNSHLLSGFYARISPEFCGTSEFSGTDWAVAYGC